MIKVKEIEKAIEALPEMEFEKLREWFAEKDWKKWDSEIKSDSEAGKLDFLEYKRLYRQGR
jgi:hypothetical protein